jgi:hypothetical protein
VPIAVPSSSTRTMSSSAGAVTAPSSRIAASGARDDQVT